MPATIGELITEGEKLILLGDETWSDPRSTPMLSQMLSAMATRTAISAGSSFSPLTILSCKWPLSVFPILAILSKWDTGTFETRSPGLVEFRAANEKCLDEFLAPETSLLGLRALIRDRGTASISSLWLLSSASELSVAMKEVGAVWMEMGPAGETDLEPGSR
ncbi:hypothetical protein OGATHE_001131 [Ogataea polymorpha]|uniref:Uncharacterized protein n=1 Tax=Ogataea polymorpha TaxID=460523 RepID=A0A9P8PR93_9ASCO|nr:hypothetical protein OGATHE_001131 [Ogataea polymorpha]